MEDATDPADCNYAVGCESCSGEQDGSGVIVYNDDDEDGYCNIGSGIAPEEILGCTQDWADNYYDQATEEDYSCLKEGCTEDWADNYDTLATQNTLHENSCYKIGCTYSWAYNYDENATIDDDSCFLPIVGCTDENACNFIPLIGDPFVDVNTDDGSCTYIDGVCNSCENGIVIDNDLDNDGFCDLGSGISPEEIVGCTDEFACNYDATPTTDTDNSICNYTVGCQSCSGETDGSGVIVYNDDDEDGYCNIGSGIVPEEIEGCQDALACNYMEAATDPADCNYAVGCESCSGEQDGSGVIVDNDADNDGYCDLGSGIAPEEIEGCKKPSACNYDATPTTDVNNTLCTFVDGVCDTCENGIVIDNDSDNDGFCDLGSGIVPEEIEGCQDASACNYMEAATDPADCIIATGCESCSGETDGTGYIVDNDADDDGFCDLGSGMSPEEIEGCQDASACNYMETATDPADCILATGCESCSGETGW